MAEPAPIRIAVAGAGAVGSAVCRALTDGIPGFTLTAVSDLNPDQARKLIGRPGFDLSFAALDDLPAKADWIVEALPAKMVPALAEPVMKAGKTLVLISSAALLLYPELRDLPSRHGGKFLIPSGALGAMDAVNALAVKGIRGARLVTTKPPGAYTGAPHIVNNNIDLKAVTKPETIFSGNALQAAAAFPANVNVAATLTVASRLPAESVEVEVRADPALTGNCHEITVAGDFSKFTFKVENLPDPANPKSSALTALSIIAALRRETAPLWIG